MPAKNTIRVRSYLTEAQIETVKQIDPDLQMSALIRNLLQQYVEANGGTWPPMTPRGKYPRNIIVDYTSTDSKTIGTYSGDLSKS